MIAECEAGNGIFGVVRAQREGLSVVGCTALIARTLERYSDGRLDILCEGGERFEIETLDNSRSFLQAEVDLLPDFPEAATRGQREECIGLHYEALDLAGSDIRKPVVDLEGPISFQLAAGIPAELDFKQELLSLRSDAQRTIRLLEFYNAILPKLRRGAHASLSASQNGHVM